MTSDTVRPVRKLVVLVQLDVELGSHYDVRLVDMLKSLVDSAPLGIKGASLIQARQVLGDAGVCEGGYSGPCRGQAAISIVPVVGNGKYSEGCRCEGMGFRLLGAPGLCDIDPEALVDPLNDLRFLERCDRCAVFGSDFEAAHAWFSDVREIYCPHGNPHAVVRQSSRREERMSL